MEKGLRKRQRLRRADRKRKRKEGSTGGGLSKLEGRRKQGAVEILGLKSRFESREKGSFGQGENEKQRLGGGKKRK